MDRARFNLEKVYEEEQEEALESARRDEKIEKMRESGVGEDIEGFEVEEMEAGDEFMAVKPWLGAMKEPTGFKDTFNNKKLK